MLVILGSGIFRKTTLMIGRSIEYHDNEFSAIIYGGHRRRVFVDALK